MLSLKIGTNHDLYPCYLLNYVKVDTHDDDYDGYDDEEHASHTGNGNSHSGGHYNEVNLADAPGRCRYDAALARVNPNAACLCVATRKNCEYGRDGCCW